MFVPAPTLRSSGTVTRTGVVAVNNARIAALTPEQALSALGGTTLTASSIFGRRQRANLTKGTVGYKSYKPTPYMSAATRCTPYGSSYVVVRNQWPPSTYTVQEVRGFGCGYTGVQGTGQGTPWQALDWTSISGYPGHAANRASIINLRNRVENQAKLKAMAMKMDLSETFVDIGSTVKMVARRTSQLGSAINAIRRGKFLDAARHLGLTRRPTANTAAQAWLELQYGWRPLVSDIQAGVSLVNQGLSRSSGTVTVTRRGRTGLEIPFQTDSNYDDYQATGSALGYCETKYVFRVSNPNLAYLTSLGISNPLYAAWVAIPMSFIVDWLIPVGEWLQGMTSTLGLTFVSGYTTVKAEMSVDVSAIRVRNFSSSNTGVVRRGGRCGHRVQHVIMRRYVHNSFPSSRLYFRFPFSSSQRIASAIALTQLLTTRR